MELECQICFEKFSPSGDRIPKVLHCGHSFCKSCVSKVSQRSGERIKITCPRRCKDFYVKNIDELGNNFSLIECLENQNVNLCSVELSMI